MEPEELQKKAKALRTIGREVGVTIRNARDYPEVFRKQVELKKDKFTKQAEEWEKGGLQQPVYDPIDLIVDLATGGGKLWARLIDSVLTGMTMTGIDAAGGGALTQVAGAAGGKLALQGVRTTALKAIERRVEQLGGRPVLDEAGKIVFHGTPHKFAPTKNNPLGEFDLSKMGTGEGAQAYGHGIYLAESPHVAKSYKEGLGKFELNGGDAKKWLDSQPSNPMELASREKITIEEAASKFNQMKDKMLAVDYALTYGDNAEYMLKQRYPEAANLYKKMVDSGELVNKGHLLTVDLPDEHIAKMLDWDKPLSEQSEAVQKSVKIAFAEAGIPNAHEMNPTGNSINAWISSAMGKGGKANNAELQKRGAELLRKHGILGIKYHDAMSRQAGEGTRNFVLFDPSIAKIIGRE